jgi:uncharacterized phiE125 gp8 family phage protein
MNWSLNKITEPEIEPVTLAELKLQTHITFTDQDAILNSYIKAARVQAEEYQRQSYITQTWELSFDGYPEFPIFLLRPPVQSLVSVKIYDEDNVETSMALDNFYLDTSSTPARLCFAEDGEWPLTYLRKIDAVKIRYDTGFGDDTTDVPENIRHAIMLMAAFMDDNRAADAELPKAFWHLLQPTRVPKNEPWQ